MFLPNLQFHGSAPPSLRLQKPRPQQNRVNISMGKAETKAAETPASKNPKATAEWAAWRGPSGDIFGAGLLLLREVTPLPDVCVFAEGQTSKNPTRLPQWLHLPPGCPGEVAGAFPVSTKEACSLPPRGWFQEVEEGQGFAWRVAHGFHDSKKDFLVVRCLLGLCGRARGGRERNTGRGMGCDIGRACSLGAGVHAL